MRSRLINRVFHDRVSALVVAGTCLLTSACGEPAPGEDNADAESASESPAETTGEPGGEPGGGTSSEPGEEPGEETGFDEGYEEWCQVCVDPVNGSQCGYVDGPAQWVDVSVLDSEADIAVGDAMRLKIIGWPTDLGPSVNWRLNRADDSLAIAGRSGYSGYVSVGLDALPATMVGNLCTPECAGDLIFQELGLKVEAGGEQATLFGGSHATVGDREVWVLKMRALACDKWGDSGALRNNSVFLSAID